MDAMEEFWLDAIDEKKNEKKNLEIRKISFLKNSFERNNYLASSVTRNTYEFMLREKTLEIDS